MGKRLRIAQLAPIASPVTPHSTGSIEQLVWLLTEELVRRGHEITLCATGDSRTSAALHAVYPHGYEDDPDLWNWQFHEIMHVASVFEHADDFDVIHSHVYHFALPFTRLVQTPVVHTYHTLLDEDIVRLYARYPEAQVAAISSYQRRQYPDVREVTVIPHGIDIAAFPFNPARGDYLLFLGRILPDKGLVEAIRIARQAGMRLILAGPHDEDEEYFRTEVAPRVDGREVQYTGPVDVAERNRLLAGAAALLYPLREPEPFGLVLVEAMACGTPILAHAIGAVPEIVDNGVTGQAVADLESLADYLPAVLALDRARVRETAEVRFDYRRMADGYEALYRWLAADSGGRVPIPSDVPRGRARARSS